MEFLKANIINLYCTGEAGRLLDPIGRLLAFSDRDLDACRAGLVRQARDSVPLAGAAAAVDSATGYLTTFFGMSSA
jgi:hypothetical protein